MTESGNPAHPVERVLALHYLLCEAPVIPTGELISFRELPGGHVYWEPFRSRTVIPLEKYFGNNLKLLQERLDRVAWEGIPAGDLGAAIQGAGKLAVTLVYRTGDEEFLPGAEIFFDSCIRRVYSTEDAAVLAGRICMELMRR